MQNTRIDSPPLLLLLEMPLIGANQNMITTDNFSIAHMNETGYHSAPDIEQTTYNLEGLQD